MTSTQVAMDLRAAAEILRRERWTQEAFTGPGGCHCMAGAVGLAVASSLDDAVFTPRWRKAMDTLAKFLGGAPWPTVVYHWNDHPDRTADEVIATLESAANAVEAGS